MANAVPNVPPFHADEKEHRRLLANKANAIGFEQGEFTPGFDFATTGDLSNNYITQDGDYWLMGPLLHFSLRLDVTPTHTTSSGEAQVTGFPYQASSTYPLSIMPVRLGGTGITWALDDVVAFVRAGEQTLQIAFQGTAAAGQSMAAADITSATNVDIFVTGFYPIDL